jgi:hypothetical protein
MASCRKFAFSSPDETTKHDQSGRERQLRSERAQEWNLPRRVTAGGGSFRGELALYHRWDVSSTALFMKRHETRLLATRKQAACARPGMTYPCICTGRDEEFTPSPAPPRPTRCVLSPCDCVWRATSKTHGLLCRGGCVPCYRMPPSSRCDRLLSGGNSIHRRSG